MIGQTSSTIASLRLPPLGIGSIWRLTLTKNPTAPTGVRAGSAWEESMKRITYGMQRRARRCALAAKNRWSLALDGGLTSIALTASAKIHSAISCGGHQPVLSTAIPTTHLNILEH